MFVCLFWYLGEKCEPPTYFFDVFLGVNSASKDYNKKAFVENKEIPDVGILSFSPERRWVSPRQISSFCWLFWEAPRIQRATGLSRSRSLDMAVTGDSGKKKRGGKVFGSLERGLDKMINMLTPSKRRALRDGPRKIRVPEITRFPRVPNTFWANLDFLSICSHSTMWLWPVRPTQTRSWTRSSPSYRRKTWISHRRGKTSSPQTSRPPIQSWSSPLSSLKGTPSSVGPRATSGR